MATATCAPHSVKQELKYPVLKSEASDETRLVGHAHAIGVRGEGGEGGIRRELRDAGAPRRGVGEHGGRHSTGSVNLMTAGFELCVRALDVRGQPTKIMAHGGFLGDEMATELGLSCDAPVVWSQSWPHPELQSASSVCRPGYKECIRSVNI